MAITNLTNSKWLIKKPSEISKLPGITSESNFYVSTKITYSNYVSNISTYLRFTPSSSTNGIIVSQYPSNSSGIYPRFTIVSLGGTNYDVSYIPSYTGTPITLGDVECTLEITGGTDQAVTNANLIAWLEENATLIESSNSYKLSHSLTNLTKGNITFTITPDTGYALPSTSAGITVTNGTLVSYDNTTGVIVVSGDDTTTISVTCVDTQISFTVDNVQFQAESGMTWADWCSSDYNTGEWVAEYGSVHYLAGRYDYFVQLNGTNVKPTDAIINGTTYTIYTVNAGGGGASN